MCNYKDYKFNLLKHYNQQHDISIEAVNLQFSNFEQFEIWKDKMEKQKVAKYVRTHSVKTQNKTFIYYVCHRDGFYKSNKKINYLRE